MRFETSEKPANPAAGPLVTRRAALARTGCGFGSLALAGLLGQQALADGGALAPRTPHHPPRAKRVIFLFMQGGPSHIDTFDP
ncbi:MAG TPA: DUF1501 domain-containing protein, partial [Thermomicrobiales bacterium]|nr:DUF1501 domain-containing protein [Thermomicrobiales bacterium]